MGYLTTMAKGVVNKAKNLKLLKYLFNEHQEKNISKKFNNIFTDYWARREKDYTSGKSLSDPFNFGSNGLYL